MSTQLFSKALCLFIMVFSLTTVLTSDISAQGPNDCEGAVVICSDGPVSYTPQGMGNQDFTNNGCLFSGERQSAWYYIEFNAQMPADQELVFTIAPTAGFTDWDFAMWGPDVGCDELDDAGMVRCNYDAAGVTGLSFNLNLPNFDSFLVVQPGEGFYLMVNNYTQNTTSFTIEWGGSAAAYLNCLPECDLVADAGPDISVCDGESFELNAMIGGSNGTETLVWRTIPSNLQTYIADSTSSSTMVNIPPGLEDSYQIIAVYTEDACQTTDTILITEDVPVPTITDTSIINVSDCVTPNGELAITAQGNNLEYSIDGGATWSNAATYNGLEAGAYDIAVRDATHPMCMEMISIEIDDITPPSITDVQLFPLMDCNTGDGAIEIAANGNDLEYSIDNGMTWQTSNRFELLAHGNYTISVRLTGNSSCLDSRTIEIENPECACDVVFTPEIQDVACNGELTGSILVTPSEEINQPSISWNNGASALSIDQLAAGTYTYELNYNDFCTHLDTIQITEPSAISFDVSASDATCELNPDGSVLIENAIGGTGLLVFEANEEVIVGGQLSNIMPGNYTITARDEAGCEISQTTSVGILPEPQLTIVGPAIIEAAEPLTLSGSYVGGLADSVRWTNETGRLATGAVYETIAMQSDIYTFQIFYANCQSELTQEVTVIPPKFYYPEAFSPNDNGINERFFVQAKNSLGAVPYDIQIFNRWGSQVFGANQLLLNNSQQGWDGTINGKSAPEGVYVYTSTIYFDQDNPRTVSGSFVLVR